MYQLCNLINRTSAPSDPSKNMNAADDFLLLLLHMHVVAAAKVLQSVNLVTSVSDLATSIAINFVRLPQTTSSQLPATCEDGVHPARSGGRLGPQEANPRRAYLGPVLQHLHCGGGEEAP